MHCVDEAGMNAERASCDPGAVSGEYGHANGMESRKGTRRRLRRDGERKGGMIRTKRIYEPPAPEDGKRFLVDRLWPRGVKVKDRVSRRDTVCPSAYLRSPFPRGKQNSCRSCSRSGSVR